MLIAKRRLSLTLISGLLVATIALAGTMLATGQAQATTYAGTDVDVPAAAEWPDYDGTTQSCGIPESDAYVLSGDLNATEAGEYRVTATLNEGYRWSDGTFDPKVITWQIARKIDDGGVGIPVAPGGTIIDDGGVAIPEEPNGTIIDDGGVGIPVFSDVDYSSWYADAIDFVGMKGYMTGYADGTGAFGVGKPMTRAEFASVLCRVFMPQADVSPTANATGMADVVDDSWYSGAANVAVSEGWIKGVDNGDGTLSFNPDGALTLEDMAVIFERICTDSAFALSSDDQGGGTGAHGGSSVLDRFSDSASISEHARASVEWAIAEGLINGNADGTLDPTGSVTRERAAAILYNLFQSQ